MQPTSQGVLVQVKALVSLIVAVITILTACATAVAWSVGKYTALTDTLGALDRRVVILETTNANMAGDVKEMKSLLIQLMSARGDRQDLPHYRR